MQNSITETLLKIVNCSQGARNLMCGDRNLWEYKKCTDNSQMAFAYRGRKEIIPHLMKVKKATLKCYHDMNIRLGHRWYSKLSEDLEVLRNGFIRSHFKLGVIIRKLEAVNSKLNTYEWIAIDAENEDDAVLAELSWHHEMQTLAYLNDASQWKMPS